LVEHQREGRPDKEVGLAPVRPVRKRKRKHRLEQQREIALIIRIGQIALVPAILVFERQVRQRADGIRELLGYFVGLHPMMGLLPRAQRWNSHRRQQGG